MTEDTTQPVDHPARPVPRIPLAMLTALGLLFAPILGGGIALPIYFLISDMFRGSLQDSNLLRDLSGAARFGAFMGGFLGVAPAYVFGWPLHVLLLRTGKTHIVFYLGLGVALGAASFALVPPLFGLGYADDSFPELVVAAGLCGAIGGMVFWLLRRPDRDFKSSEPAA